MTDEKTCGTCRHTQWMPHNEEFVCSNRDSDYFGCPCFYDDTCEDGWEEKE